MRETVEIFGETLRYDDEKSHRDSLCWAGDVIRIYYERTFSDDDARWAIVIDYRTLFFVEAGHRSVAEAAQASLAKLMDQIEDRTQATRHLLAGINAELRGGEA